MLLQVFDFQKMKENLHGLHTETLRKLERLSRSKSCLGKVNLPIQCEYLVSIFLHSMIHITSVMMLRVFVNFAFWACTSFGEIFHVFKWVYTFLDNIVSCKSVKNYLWLQNPQPKNKILVLIKKCNTFMSYFGEVFMVNTLGIMSMTMMLSCIFFIIVIRLFSCMKDLSEMLSYRDHQTI